jgi:hypothetical protein
MTVVAMEKPINITRFECVFVTLIIQQAMRLCRSIVFVAYLAVPYFSNVDDDDDDDICGLSSVIYLIVFDVYTMLLTPQKP